MIDHLRQFRGIQAIHSLILRFLIFVSSIFALAGPANSTELSSVPFKSNCASFQDVDNRTMDVDIKSGLPMCKATTWASFRVYLTWVRVGNRALPIVVYNNDSSVETVVVYIHGGPRQLVGLIDTTLLYGSPINKLSFVRPTYIGSLNRTNYPRQDFEMAIDEIRETIGLARKSGLRTVLSADSAGSLLLGKACQEMCDEHRVLMAPMLKSPHDTSLANVKISSACQADPSNAACKRKSLNGLNAQVFGNMLGNRIVTDKTGRRFKSTKVIIDGNRQAILFYGVNEYMKPNDTLIDQDTCFDIIYDADDPVIGVERIELLQKRGCAKQLHRVQNFRHPLFVNLTSALAIYWNQVRTRARANIRP